MKERFTIILDKCIGELVKHPVKYFVLNQLLLLLSCIFNLPHLFLLLFIAAFVTALNFLWYMEEDL